MIKATYTERYNYLKKKTAFNDRFCDYLAWRFDTMSEMITYYQTNELSTIMKEYYDTVGPLWYNIKPMNYGGNVV